MMDYVKDCVNCRPPQRQRGLKENLKEDKSLFQECRVSPDSVNMMASQPSEKYSLRVTTERSMFAFTETISLSTPS